MYARTASHPFHMRLRISTRVFVDAHTCTHIYIYLYTYIYIPIPIYLYIHAIHTHTHTHTGQPLHVYMYTHTSRLTCGMRNTDILPKDATHAKVFVSHCARESLAERLAQGADKLLVRELAAGSLSFFFSPLLQRPFVVRELAAGRLSVLFFTLFCFFLFPF